MRACTQPDTSMRKPSHSRHMERAGLAGRPLPLIMDDGSQKEKKESAPGEKKKDHDHCRVGSNSGSGTGEGYNVMLPEFRI